MSIEKLPDSWLKVDVGIVADIISGGTPKSGVIENFTTSGEGIAWLTPADLSGYKDKYISNGARDLTEKGYSSSSAKLMPAGSILFSSRAPIGYTAIAANKISTNQGFKNFVFTSDIYPDYAYYYLRSIKHLAESMGTGTTFKEISGSSAKKLPFIISPLAEQKIITDKLDDLLARVESIKTRLENIPEILKKFRQSVLSVGLSGGFSNANDRVLHSLCNKWQWPELPSNWKVSKYSELVDSRLGKMLDKVKNSGSPTHYLGNINVRWFDFDLTNIQRIMVSDKERIELSLEYGDVLICEGGEPGRCAVWRQDDLRNIIFQKALHRARVKNEIIPEWLIYNLKNDSDNLSLYQLFTGTTIKHLTGKALANYPLRVPPVKEQKEIVEYIKKLFTYADSIQYMSEKSLLRINNLTQSILAKAFRGELTAQWREENPDLISGLNSAEALLEKITAEKLAAGTIKKRAKKSSH